MLEKNPVITTSRRLPSGRAVLGGLFITLAVLGVLVAGNLRENATYQDVVLADRTLAPGTVLGPEDVRVARLRLDEQVGFVVSDPTSVYGSVLLGPLQTNEFVQAANLTTATADGLAEVSVPVSTDSAPAQLIPGELVSILVTYGGSPARTELVADRVTVISYERSSDDFATSATAVLRLGLGDGDTAARIVLAAETGEVSIIGIGSAPEVVIPEVVQ